MSSPSPNRLVEKIPSDRPKNTDVLTEDKLNRIMDFYKTTAKASRMQRTNQHTMNNDRTIDQVEMDYKQQLNITPRLSHVSPTLNGSRRGQDDTFYESTMKKTHSI